MSEEYQASIPPSSILLPVCQWRETQADVYFGTVRPGCREGGSLAAEDVTEFKACPYCGKPLALVPAEQTNKE